MNPNSLNQGMSISPDVVPDPLPGNTTVGAAKLPCNLQSIIRLVATQAVTQEERTLPDPVNAGILLGAVLYSTAGANLRITASSPINSSSQTHVIFTAAGQYVEFRSVPYRANGVNGLRWEQLHVGGTTVN